MKMIVGLGNPGNKYSDTRHNVGFMVLDKLVVKNNLQFNLDKTMQAEVATININGEKVWLVKPFTYMNESGRSAQALKAYYQIKESDTLVIYDDLDLKVGQVRMRQKGSAGGHNGIRSIMNMTSWQKFKRIRIGIDHPKAPKTVVDHVLGKFTKTEQVEMELAFDKAIAGIEAWLDGETFEKIMTKYN